MAQRSIARRIGTITLGLMAGLMLMAAAGLLGTWSVASRVTAIAEAAEKVELAVDASQHKFAAETARNVFRATPGPDAITAFDDSTAVLAKAVRSLQAKLSPSDPLHPAIEAVLGAENAYGTAFDVITTWQDTHEKAVTILNETGPQIRQALNSTATTMIFDGNQRAILALQDARQAYLLGRIAAERYLMTNEAEAYETAQAQLTTAMELAETSARVTKIDARRDAIAGVFSHLDQYRTTFAEAAFAIDERNAARATMSDAADGLNSALATVFTDLSLRQSQTRDQAVIAQRLAFGLILTIALTGLIAGTVFARRVAASITGSLEASVANMTELASGNLEIDIPGQEYANELGDIARALVVFRDTAQETRALEAQSRRAEEDQRRKEAEQATQAQKAENLRQEQAEADRKAVVTSLRQSLGGVVDAAAEGDFSQRIDSRFDDPQLDAMASSINRLVETVETGVSETAGVMGALAGGDLTRRIEGRYDGTFGELKTSVNHTIETLAQLVRDIAGQCSGLSAEMDAMTAQSGELSRRAEDQASSLEETSAVMEEMRSTARSSAEGTQSASDTAAKATSEVEQAGQVVGQAVAAMGDIRGASERIGEIVSVIEGIAFQTNLLALNASVEAARAGSAGKGFAVVATEVRALAQRSSEASHDIKELIEETTDQVNRGVALVESTGATLDNIVGGVRDMAQVMTDLTTSSREQASGVESASQTITQIDMITQKNAALAEDGRATATRATRQAGVIRDMVTSFRLEPSEGGAEAGSGVEDGEMPDRLVAAQ